MKIKLFLSITVVSFIVFLLTNCKRYDDISGANQDVRVSIVSASATAKKYSLMMADTLNTISFEVAHDALSGKAGSDISVEFKVSPGLVDEYNKYNETTYLPMPEGSYELPASAEIQNGNQKSDPVKIKIKTAGALEAFQQYLLPVSIDSVSSGFVINQNAKTIYFLIESIREGFTIKVMSYGKGGGVYDMNQAAAIIKQYNPDLLLVREMDSLTNRSGKTDQPAVLAQLIGMPNYIYATSIAGFDGGQYGCTLYSKFPIVESKEVILPTGDANTEKGPFGAITIQVNGNQKLIFAGTHLNANASRRAAELPVLINTLNTFNDPVILAGNFNETPPSSNVYTALSGALFNFPCTSCQANTPATSPTGYSDFILYKPASKLKVLSYTIGSSSTSAHLPVITEFLLFKD